MDGVRLVTARAEAPRGLEQIGCDRSSRAQRIARRSSLGRREMICRFGKDLIESIVRHPSIP
jgi:hypothetical protein